MTTVRRLAGIAGALALGAGLLPAMAVPAAAAPAWRPADDGAKIIGSKRINASTLDLTVQSPAVGRKLTFRVQTPKGWSRTAKRTWPTVYALPGGGGDDDQTTWFKQTDIAKVAAKWNVLVVSSYAAASGGFVDWFNYGKRGKPRWETYHTVELRQLVERNLRGGGSRAVMGVSSGAAAAIGFAARHPRMYRYAASFSGTLHITRSGVPAILMATNMFHVGNSDPFRIWGVPGVNDANWRAHDPYHLAPRLRGTGTKLYVSGGTTGDHGPLDPPGMSLPDAIGGRLVGGLSEQLVGLTSKDFIARARQLKLPLTAHMYGDGWHQWKYWQREMHYAWPQIMKALGATRV